MTDAMARRQDGFFTGQWIPEVHAPKYSPKEDEPMKRIVMVVSVVVLLLAGFPTMSLALPAGTPDVTPPVIYGIGNTPVVYLSTKTCAYMQPHILMVQAKVSDAGGVSHVWVQYKQPLDLTWRTVPMTLRPDGYWRAFINAPWTVPGTGDFRIKAQDYRPNTTISGVRSFSIRGCDPLPD